MTNPTSESIHSCSYYCDRPECIKRQRDEMRDAKPVAEVCHCDDGAEPGRIVWIADPMRLPDGTLLYKLN